MVELRVDVPTYVARCPSLQKRREVDFAEPSVPVVVREADGIRIVLGTDDRDVDAPDVQIERRPSGWVIFLHPLGGCDPSGLIYFLDDGRSFVMPENDFGPTMPIKFREYGEEVTEVDDVPGSR